MEIRSLRLAAVAGVAAAATAAAMVAAGPANAATHPSTVYVSPTGHGTNADTSCATAGFHTVQSGVNWVLAGGTVIVCGGTYHESVSVLKKVAIVGQSGATIDATGFPYGIGLGASYSSVTGMTVKNAGTSDPQSPNDGIVTAAFGPNGPVAGDHEWIAGNVLTGNANAGIDLNSTQYSTARGNQSNQNGIGVNVSDDLGRLALYNNVEGNVTDENFGGCGIALADHTGAGVAGTRVTGNRSDDNGLSTPTAPDASAGSGVIMASPIPNGRVSGNLIQANSFDGNGHGGVVLHAHAPGGNFAGNWIVGNRIKENNLRTDSHDLQTTGVYIGTVSPLTIKIDQNNIGPDYYGIFTAGSVTITGSNSFTDVTQSLGHVSAY